MNESAAGSSVWEPEFISLMRNRKQQIGPKMSELHAGRPLTRCFGPSRRYWSTLLPVRAESTFTPRGSPAVLQVEASAALKHDERFRADDHGKFETSR